MFYLVTRNNSFSGAVSLRISHLSSLPSDLARRSLTMKSHLDVFSISSSCQWFHKEIPKVENKGNSNSNIVQNRTKLDALIFTGFLICATFSYLSFQRSEKRIEIKRLENGCKRPSYKLKCVFGDDVMSFRKSVFIFIAKQYWLKDV